MNQKGFSLVEILVVIALVGILSAIAMLYVPGMLDSYKVRGAARQLYSDMQMARLRAIKEGKVMCIIFNGSPFTSYTVVEAGANNVCDSGGDIVDAAGEKTVDIASEYSGVTMTHTFSDNTLNFNPNGTSENNTVTLTRGARTIRLTVNQNTGNIRIS